MVRLDWTYLGCVPYGQALDLQNDCAREVAAGAPPRLYLCEHPPTITLGRQANPANLKLSPEAYRSRGFEIARVSRGGDVTYHGPGQLVGYPIVSLNVAGCTVPEWVQGNAEAITRFLGHYGIRASWSCQHPGIWVNRKKIAALGFRISRRISTHGFAINLAPDLNHFDTIVPCGLKDLGVTSMQALQGRVPLASAAAEEVAGRLAEVFGWSLGDELDACRGDGERIDVAHTSTCA